MARVFVFFVFVLVGGALRAQDVTAFHHKQWQARCGTEYCTLHARAYQYFALSRSNWGGPWVLTFYSAGMIETSDVNIDGQEMDWRAGDEMPMPAALIEGSELAIVDEEMGYTDVTSLAGIKAAMLWAEVQQGGEVADRRLAVRQPDWFALRDQAWERTREDCEIDGGPSDDVGESIDDIGLRTLNGHPELRIVSQICWMAAYNVGSHVYILGPLLDDLAPVRAAAQDPYGSDRIELETFGIEDDPQDIWTIGKGRGVGDCFTQEHWRFDHFRYRLVTRIEDHECDGKILPLVTYPE